MMTQEILQIHFGELQSAATEKPISQRNNRFSFLFQKSLDETLVRATGWEAENREWTPKKTRKSFSHWKV